MLAATTCWLAYTLGLAAFVAPHTRTVGAGLAFALAACLALPAATLPLGYASPWAPTGKYVVVGAFIDVEGNAIYALLQADGGEPRYYRLPYTAGSAEALQEAMDGEGQVTAEVGGDGGAAFEGEPSVSGDADKQPEQPIFGGFE